MVYQSSANARTGQGQGPHSRGWVKKPCTGFHPRSNHPYARGNKNMLDTVVRKRKNLLV